MAEQDQSIQSLFLLLNEAQGEIATLDPDKAKYVALAMVNAKELMDLANNSALSNKHTTDPEWYSSIQMGIEAIHRLTSKFWATDERSLLPGIQSFLGAAVNTCRQALP